MTFLLLSLAGCDLLTTTTAADTTVVWAGYVARDPFDGQELTVLSEGSVVFTDLDGAVLVEAEQPYEDAPGWWLAELEPETEVAIRVGGPDQATMVWRGQTPARTSYWRYGGLLTRDAAALQEVLEALDPDTTFAPLSEGEVVHLWAEPWSPDRWVGADISVTDAAGAEAEVITFTEDDSGLLRLADVSDPIVFFAAAGLAPGQAILTVTPAAGPVVTETWPTQGGDLVSALYFALAEEG